MVPQLIFLIASPFFAFLLAQERVLDHVFDRIGIDTQGRVEHPVVMTEALCNPVPARAQLQELLFET